MKKRSLVRPLQWVCIMALVALGLIQPSASAQEATHTLPRVAGMEERWIEVLRELVETNSGSANPDGLEKNREILIDAFASIGFQATEHDAGNGHKVLSFEKEGAEPELALVGHLDTVFEEESSFQELRIEGDRLIGPGVIDMKGGLVMMLDLAERLNQTDSELASKVRIVINDDEETGSVYSKSILKELTKDLSYALVLEPGLPDGSVVTAHMGVRWLQIDVKGKAAHAGMEPQQGIDACTEAAYKMTKMVKMTNYDGGPYVNPGVVEGGTKPNVICEEASVKIDVRYVEEKDLKRVMKKLGKITDRSYVYNPVLEEGTTSTLKQLAALPAMPPASTDELFAIAQAAGEELGQTVTGQAVGYGSDANHLAETEVNLLVGLGPYGGAMHTDEEYMLISSYVSRLQLNEAIIRKALTD
ncbi:M20/M25/M40 family metallo-hydrolase [Mechercharimyces sp. CAU 1602]|uniref:M20/M25/M40 family metallo-hydrolase n=1 Tax=Mechercharimyces sp. CAU 1602 TaxID=2973933 RepID=UPI00216240D8|nr:M20/M25/M40 family metallo-hydrolase [Mechercharimyces sp. CAU 1602]MCS1350243.1 M20/M25/M40 family metallo-hydrolase [Mechercharimyces sp. CAU 1602]